jgi:DNA-binding helix-hairpin-helix protein with protein kinase domain
VRAATNTARAFAAIHAAGCVIGDVNHGGVLVGQDATVTLIDCDSFQVTHGGRRFLCEVGVETFTPPELQGRSFQGVVRDVSHDDFGLAVMTFLLLFMGRHPFAGRFSGPGDMPISRAIEEHRFAYGRQRSARQMTQPPGTPSLSIVGPAVELLFEKAFASDAQQVGRPAAREWIAALEGLEADLKQCGANPSHWHHRSTACPWCPMEGATGVALFPVVVQSAAGTMFDLTRLWQEVEAIRHPGSAPTIDVPMPEPSEAAQKLAGRTMKRHVMAATAAALVAALGIALGPVMLLAAGVMYVVVLAANDGTGKLRPITEAHDAASARWDKAEKEWLLKAGPAVYDQRKTVLVNLREEWNQVPTVRLRKLAELDRDRERAQRLRFLDAFEVEKAKIEGIGKGRKLTLASYGIETAADVTQSALTQVPGFGPKMQARMLAWRSDVEKRFVFDASRLVDARDVARVEQEILARKMEIEKRMNVGLAELRQANAQILSARQHMHAQVLNVRLEFLQALADKQVAS